MMTFRNARARGKGYGQGIWALLLVLLLSGGCGSGEASVDEADGSRLAEEKARRAAEKLVGTLMGEVQQSIKDRGLAGTVTHCAERAQELSALIGAEEGVTIRRVTEKTRNPVDAPDVYERQVLGHFAALAQSGQMNSSTAHVEIVREDSRRMLRFLKPITVMKPCLGCHGPENAIAADVRAAIRAQYPSDRATGYSVGDLRGAISVVVPLDEE